MSKKAVAEKTEKKSEKSPSIRDFAEGRKDIYMIDPRKIEVKKGFNVREDFGDIDALAQSIKENGLRIPLRVFIEDGAVTLCDGNRRHRAIEKLIKEGIDIKKVPCIAEDKGMTIEQRTLGLIISNDGKPLTPLEEAKAVSRLLKYGWTVQKICDKTGRTAGHISQLKLISDLPNEIEKAITDNKIAPTYVMELARKCEGDCEKMTKMVSAGIKKAEALGKTKVTKKIAEEGTIKRQSKKERDSQTVAILQGAIEAIRSDNNTIKEDMIDAIETYIARLCGAAVPV